MPIRGWTNLLEDGRYLHPEIKGFYIRCYTLYRMVTLHCAVSDSLLGVFKGYWYDAFLEAAEKARELWEGDDGSPPAPEWVVRYGCSVHWDYVQGGKILAGVTKTAHGPIVAWVRGSEPVRYSDEETAKAFVEASHGRNSPVSS